MRKLFAAVALAALLLGMGKAVAEDAWFRPVTHLTLTNLTTTEVTTGAFRGTGLQYFRLVLAGATGYVSFYDLTTQTFGSPGQVMRVYLPSNTPVDVSVGRGQIISIKENNNQGGHLEITGGEAAK